MRALKLFFIVLLLSTAAVAQENPHIVEPEISIAVNNGWTVPQGVTPNPFILTNLSYIAFTFYNCP